VIEFCSATHSRATMEADPHTLAYCPYTIAVYVLAAEPKRVCAAYRKFGRERQQERSRSGALDQPLGRAEMSEAAPHSP